MKIIHPIDIFLQGTSPLIDVRTPQEYADGHIPGSINLPILDNNQRSAVGTTYKEIGKKEALILGMKAVAPMLKSLTESLQKLKSLSKEPLRIYCSRGGFRSKSMLLLCQRLGLQAQLCDGGYKTYRSWVIEQLQHTYPIRLVGGFTGCGKTRILQQIALKGHSFIDIEKLASHRGSVFGGLHQPLQPTQEHFENMLAMHLFNCRHSPIIWLEDESRTIGRCTIPNSIYTQMESAPIFIIQGSLNYRMAHLMEDYGHTSLSQALDALFKLKKKLGSEAISKISQDLYAGRVEKALLQVLDYYDKSYLYSLTKKNQQKIWINQTWDNPSDCADYILQHENLMPALQQ